MSQNSVSAPLRAGAYDVRLNRAALAFLRHLKMAFKAFKIYEPSNQIVQGQTHVLFSLLDAILQEEGRIDLLHRESTLFFNGNKVRFAFNNYDLFRFLSEELKKRGIGLLAILPGLSEEELRNLLAVLVQKPDRGGATAAAFTGLLAARKVTHVQVEPPSPYESLGGGEREAIKVFFLGIVHLKELFEKFKKGEFKPGEHLPINVTRRLMHSLFNHIVNNEAFALGLTTIKNFDDYTLNHSLNVCILAIALGRRLGLDKNELTDLGISAFFHDYGKMELPKEILEKPGKLEESEWALMETHPQLGAEKLLRLRESSAVPVGAINVAMEHHIKDNLHGYPVFQKKKYISFYSQIVKVCDVFDALTTRRPYRDHTFTRDEALTVMVQDTGAGFNPIILKIFAQMLGLYPVGSLVLLDTGELAIVFEQNPEPSLAQRPRVRLITDPAGEKLVGDLVDLSETDPETGKHRWTITRILDPHQYEISVADYFLDKAQSVGSEPVP
jgi:HD-GYP domain-containing protein (c-di-GMP phosphodiesterase class II)